MVLSRPGRQFPKLPTLCSPSHSWQGTREERVPESEPQNTFWKWQTGLLINQGLSEQRGSLASLLYFRGCSQGHRHKEISSLSVPSQVYVVNRKGEGPCWQKARMPLSVGLLGRAVCGRKALERISCRDHPLRTLTSALQCAGASEPRTGPVDGWPPPCAAESNSIHVCDIILEELGRHHFPKYASLRSGFYINSLQELSFSA